MLDRRQWLRWSLATGAVAATRSTLGGCASPPRTVLEGGAATFEVTSDGALVAIYAPGGGELFVELTAPGGVVATPSIEVSAATGYTGAIELVDLAPATAYRYRVVTAAGAESAEHAFRTAPDDAAVAELRFVYAADLDLDPQFASPILDTLAATPAAFYVSLGDWPYADNPPGAQTLAEYRERHREVRVAERVRPLVRGLPIFAIYDDHEVRNDWNGYFSQVEAPRVAAALQAWDEWFPLRDRGDPPVRYRRWRWGALAELFLLDTRLCRSDNRDPDGPDKTMLGAAQKRWLEDGLAASAARFKLVLSTVPLDYEEPDSNDGWRSFASERDELVRHIVDGEIGGVVFLSADRHWFAAHHHASGLKELQVGPLARGIPELPPAAPEVVARAGEYNFGEVSVTADALTLVARAADGRELYREVVAPGRGRLRVDGATPGRAFVVTGAHRFAGVTPAEFSYAVPGRYAVSFDGGGDPVSGDLVDGGLLVLSDGDAG